MVELTNKHIFIIIIIVAFIVTALVVGYLILFEGKILPEYSLEKIYSIKKDHTDFALLSGDNLTVSYDTKTQTLLIENESGKNLINVTLDTNIVQSVLRGSEVRVAELTFKNGVDIPQTIEKMELYDKKTSQNITRTLIYKQKNFVGFREIALGKVICDLNNKSANESQCREVVNYTSIPVYEWLPFDEKTILSKGEYTIGIFTHVEAGDNVEWIPTILDYRVVQWAEWNETFNQSLNYSYPLDEGTGTNSIDFRADVNQNNLTLSTADIWQTSGCKRGNCTAFIGLSGRTIASASNMGIDGADVRTVSYWIKPVNNPIGTQINERYVGWGAATNDQAFCVGKGMSSEAKNEWGLYAHAGGDIKTVNENATEGAWSNIVLVYNGTDMKYYVNGTLYVTLDYTYATANSGLDIGHCIDANYYSNGSIDELNIWSRALSDSEVSDLWNNGDGIFIKESTVPPDNPPTVSLISPVNDTTSANNLSIHFNCTITDDNSLINASLIINNIVNLTIQNSTGDQTSLNITVIRNFAHSGEINWTCIAFDNASAIGQGENRTFNILMNMTGTTRDNNWNTISGAVVYIINQSNDYSCSCVNTTSNATGGFTYPVGTGNYTVVGIDFTNTSRDGDADPHISVP